MIKGEHDYLQDLASRNVCSEHGNPLVVAWHSGVKGWTLRCGEGHYPDATTRQLSLTEEYHAGLPLPSTIEDNIIKRERRKAMRDNKQPIALAMGGVNAVDLGTGELLVPDVVKSLTNYALKYHLDPYRGHVVLMYGKPYITLDGYMFHAYKENTPYQLRSRPLDEDERKTYLIDEGSHAWTCEIIMDDGRRSFTGMGIVTKAEMEARSPRDKEKLRSPVVAAHPWQLAQKRAEWQALRRAFPIGDTEEGKDEAGE